LPVKAGDKVEIGDRVSTPNGPGVVESRWGDSARTKARRDMLVVRLDEGGCRSYHPSKLKKERRSR